MDTITIIDKSKRLEKLGTICQGCQACRLHEGRKKVVIGEGNPDALVMFIGEAPGREESLSGRPFVGKSGQLLRKLIRAIKLDPEKDCFIANVVKCRPPGNRPPEQDEMDQCVKFLKKQIEIIKPSFLVLLGKTAVKGLYPDLADKSVYAIREMNIRYDDIKVMVTYHPSSLLRSDEPLKQYERQMATKQDFENIEILLLKKT
jgi:DNA polymerase